MSWRIHVCFRASTLDILFIVRLVFITKRTPESTQRASRFFKRKQENRRQGTL